MTEEDRLLLNDLKANTLQMFQEFRKLENEKKLLEEKLEALKNDLEMLKQENSELGRKQEKLKFANHILSGTDESGEAKKRINKIVREIDKCIALLNR